MPPQLLDYQRQDRGIGRSPWYRSDVSAACVTAATIVAANAWIVWNADKSWGFWLWVFIYIPVANAALAGVLLALSSLFRLVAGASASLHVLVTLVGCAAAIVCDAAIILGQLHGC